MKTYVLLFLILTCFGGHFTFAQDFLNQNYLRQKPLNVNADEAKENNLFLKDTTSKEVRKVTFVSLFTLPDPIENQDELIKLNNSKLSTSVGDNSAGTLYSELLVDQMGYWRFSFSSALTASKDEEDQEETTKDLQTFLAGGGQAAIKATYPLFIVFNTLKAESRNTGLHFAPRAGFNFPALGATTDDFNWNIDLGLEFETFAGGDKGKLAFMFRARPGLVWGSSGFVNQLVRNERRVFGYGAGTAGLILEKKVALLFNFPIAVIGKDDPIDRLPATVSLGFLFNQD